MGRDSNKGGNGDGKSDGIEIYPATPEDLRSYRDANADLAQMRVPQLVSEDHPNRRLFVAVMDGTGNDMHNDPVANRTGVARIVTASARRSLKSRLILRSDRGSRSMSARKVRCRDAGTVRS